MSTNKITLKQAKACLKEAVGELSVEMDAEEISYIAPIMVAFTSKMFDLDPYRLAKEMGVPIPEDPGSSTRDGIYRNQDGELTVRLTFTGIEPGVSISKEERTSISSKARTLLKVLTEDLAKDTGKPWEGEAHHLNILCVATVFQILASIRNFEQDYPDIDDFYKEVHPGAKTHKEKMMGEANRILAFYDHFFEEVFDSELEDMCDPE